MKKLTSLGALIAVFAGLLAMPAAAGAEADSWGQEVKECNAESCYPNGTYRGIYVMAEAQDSQSPGYAWEIQNLALDPQELGDGGFSEILGHLEAAEKHEGAPITHPDAWGEEVKKCNAESCYPEGTNRGLYVLVQATDSETPGYGWEIQDVALNPQELGNGGF